LALHCTGQSYRTWQYLPKQELSLGSARSRYCVALSNTIPKLHSGLAYCQAHARGLAPSTTPPHLITMGLAQVRPNQLLGLALTKSTASPLWRASAGTREPNAPKNLKKLYSYVFLDLFFLYKNIMIKILAHCY